jgi:4-oxalocrotonate tautomerase
MPFINIRIIEGHSQERKDEMARRITDVVTEVTQVPSEYVWVVFNEVSADDWYIASTSVGASRKAGK